MVLKLVLTRRGLRGILNQKSLGYKMDNQCKLTLPTLKIVLTGGKYGYKREDNVFVIPIGCLKD